MQKLVFKNGNGVEIDLTDGEKYGITDWSGLSNTDLNIQTQTVPFADGAVYLDALLGEKDIAVTVAVNDGGDLETRYELKRELIALLNPKLGEGVLTYTNDYLSKQITVVPQLPIFANKNIDDAGTLKASVTFTACIPYWEDTEATVVTLKKGLTTLTNEGEVPISLDIDIFTSSAKNLKIQNYTTDKAIEFSDEITESVNINTGVGQKSVTSQELAWEKNNNGYSFTNGMYIPDLAKYVLTGKNGNIVSGLTLTELNGSSVGNQLNYGLDYSETLGLIVVAGYNGLYTSSDGETWALVQSGKFQSVLWVDELSLFIAVGTSGTIMTSSDGETWTSQTSSVTATFTDIAYSYELELVIITGYGGTILTSPDGETWTSQTSGVTTFLYNVAWIPSLELFVVIGHSGTILTSPDGETWTSQTSGVTSYLNGIIYNPTTGNIVIVTGSGQILISSDGETWTSKTINSSYDIWDIFYDENLGLDIAVGSTGLILQSSDDENWELQSIFSGSVITGMCYSDTLEKEIFVGDNGRILTSSDGENWEIQTSGITTNLHYVACSDILIVAVGASGVILTSSDGETWISQTSGITSAFRAVAYSKQLDLFVAVAENGYALYSSDGETWTSISLSSYTLEGVVYSETLGKFVIVGGRYIFSSTDGIDWKSIYIGTVLLKDVTFSEYLGRFVAVGGSGVVYYSKDGTNWKVSNVGASLVLNRIACSDSYGLMVAVGSNMSICTSSDGENWGISNIDITTVYNTFYSAYYSVITNKYFVGGYGGLICTSYLAEKENKIDLLTADSDMSLSLAVGENQFVITANGTITGRIAYRNRYIGV